MLNKTELVRDYFNNDENYIKSNAMTMLRKLIVYDLTGTIKEKNIIDIGCGNGIISIPFLELNHVTFLDLSVNMLGEVKKVIPKNLIHKAEFINEDINYFKSIKKFDIVLLVGVLAHVQDVERCISKVSELLIENGTCIVQITNSNKIMARLLRLYSTLKNSIIKSKMMYNVNVLKEDFIESSFNKYGFSLLEKKYYLPTFPGFKLLSRNTRIGFLSVCYKTRWISRFGSEIIFKFNKDI